MALLMNTMGESSPGTMILCGGTVIQRVHPWLVTPVHAAAQGAKMNERVWTMVSNRCSFSVGRFDFSQDTLMGE